MDSERKLINLISNIMPRSVKQSNRLFESDAEIVEFAGKKLLVNVDEFSQEDRIRETDPYVLGWNLAVGAVSDIYATGGKPLYYAHSMTVNKSWSEDFVERFSKGVADVLKQTGTDFIGGDFGKSDVWRYTATVIGETEAKPLLRSGASAGDVIYISGKIGLGNLEAFMKMYSEKGFSGRILRNFKNKFKLRLMEAELIRKYATSCIDTSDGAGSSINTLAEMSGIGYKLENPPYIRAGAAAAKLFSIPRTLLFLGECGEYELLFTLKKQDEEAFLKEAVMKKLQFYKLGETCEASTKLLLEDNNVIDLEEFTIRARDYEDVKEYIKKIIDFLGA